MRSPISAPKILLEGPGGTGKTYAIRTFVPQGITPFVIALDAQGIESVADIPCPKLHWHTIGAAAKSWSNMIDESKRLLTLSYDGITKMIDANKHKQSRWIATLETLAKPKCDRCGKEFPEVDKWGTDTAIIIDHLTELSQASKEWAVGDKLVLHEGEWQVAMNNLENFIRQLTIVCRCWVVMIAHIDREIDTVRGGTKIMTHTLGRKLAPKLPVLFSDVVSAERNVKEFHWSVASPDMDLKSRNLPLEAKLPPDFAKIVETWKGRGGIIEQE